MYPILNRILNVLYCYVTYHDSLPKVFKVVVDEMKAFGYEVKVVDDKHRDYKIIQVDSFSFKVFRVPGWSKYDVICID